MPKHIDQLGSYENFEFSSLLTADEPDMEKLKKYVFGLLSDKAKAQDARDVAKAQTGEVQTELDEANAQLSSKAPADLQAKLAKAEDKVKELTDDLAKRDVEKVRDEVASEKGLTAKQAKYLAGATKEELEASADEFIKDNDITPRGDDDEDPDDEGEFTLRTTPRATALNPSDPDPRKGPEKAVDYDQVVAGFESSPFR